MDNDQFFARDMFSKLFHSRQRSQHFQELQETGYRLFLTQGLRCKGEKLAITSSVIHTVVVKLPIHKHCRGPTFFYLAICLNLVRLSIFF